MPWASVIKPLFLPPTVLLLVALLGLLLRRRRRLGRSLTWGALALLYLLATPVVGSRLLAALQPDAAFDAAAAGGAGAIVVLSADQYHHQIDYDAESVGPMTLERLRRGARLQRATGLPVLLAGGILPGHGTSIADAMADVMERDFNVAVRWREGQSRTTAENAANAARLLKADGIGKVLLVTTGWHMPRALQAFRAAGLEPVAAPTGFVVPARWEWENFLPAARALQQSQWAVHELLGRVWYYAKVAVAD